MASRSSFLTDVIRIVGAYDFSGAHDQNAVALMQNLIRLVRNKQNSQTTSRKRVDDLKDPGFGADIDAHRGRIQDQHARICREPFGQHDPLLVAAGELLDRPLRSVRLDSQFLENPAVDGLRPARAIDEARAGPSTCSAPR